MKTDTTTKKSTSRKPANVKNGKGSQGNQNASEQTPFEKLFEDMLKDIYWAEKQLVDALREMAKASTTEELKDSFEDHAYQTQRQANRLEKVFNILGKQASGKKCEAIEGLIKEAKRVKEETEEGSMTRDAGLIISAQKIEHYEIAAYGSLVQVALTLGYDEAAYILEKTLSEEEDADRKLTDIAETQVNPMADEEGSEEENEPEYETAAVQN